MPRIQPVEPRDTPQEARPLMVATIALATFSNYMNETIKTDVDIPVVEPTQSR